MVIFEDTRWNTKILFPEVTQESESMTSEVWNKNRHAKRCKANKNHTAKPQYSETGLY